MIENETKKGDLGFELYQSCTEHEKVPQLMAVRWGTRANVDPKATGEVLKEIDEVVAKTKSQKFKVDATFSKAMIKLRAGGEGRPPDASGIDEFIKIAPKDPRAAGLLYNATFFAKDIQAKTAFEDRILKEYPDSRHVNSIKGSRRARAQVGKPFDLEFADAINGSNVSVKGLKGQVVAIDFWATWCGPCVAEMPKMKELYAKYHAQGVEFIGVSLDQSKDKGGLDKLKAFVKENKIPWPQYYQGNGWESEFSVSWGINSIPCVFLVDAEGKLFSLEAGGKLEEMIPELLAKKNKIKTARAATTD